MRISLSLSTVAFAVFWLDSWPSAGFILQSVRAESESRKGLPCILRDDFLVGITNRQSRIKCSVCCSPSALRQPHFMFQLFAALDDIITPIVHDLLKHNSTGTTTTYGFLDDPFNVTWRIRLTGGKLFQKLELLLSYMGCCIYLSTFQENKVVTCCRSYSQCAFQCWDVNRFNSSKILRQPGFTSIQDAATQCTFPYLQLYLVWGLRIFL